MKSWVARGAVVLGGLGVLGGVKNMVETPTTESSTSIDENKLTSGDHGFYEMQSEKQVLNEYIQKILDFDVSQIKTQSDKDSALAEIERYVSRFQDTKDNPNLKTTSLMGRVAAQDLITKIDRISF